ncbi:Fe-S cluster assembly ATP-binding protein [Catenibacillus scindens]|uniref:Fe-S cluster assembly ATP-binding protein n=1 Tax=Catenibacillus scindens TaxID=673271 RepID=A0A7W8H7X4_9FIRM|nr:ATP-binding cassette domain-containing protein [Catenibacillus scindens]MBB5263541.1 Fe-S cluster assembly ATP-binding protein [Catenibacillus scindens]
MLELRNISFDVDENSKTKGILKNINLTLEDNKFVVVTGPNGGGKSTLAKIIAGIETPSQGQIFWNGEDITQLNVTERAKRGISYAFQQPVRFKGITVFDLIQLATGKPINVDKACEYLSAVGLCAKDYIRREVNASLSGGELKRIEIATVMARNTAMTIFDEPEAGIDLWSFQNLIQVFEKLHEQNHGNIMIISHQERILNIADEIVMIADGQLRDRGPREEMLPKIFGQIDRPEGCGCRYYEQC